MSTEPTTAPPAGWYPDPEMPQRMRWWTGTTWAAPAPETTSKPTNALAIVGFVLALVALAPVFQFSIGIAICVAALICSAAAISRARTLGGTGLTLAWWGVGISVASLALIALGNAIF